MAREYDPEATVARPLLALTTSAPSSSAYTRRRRRNRMVVACGAVTFVFMLSYAYLGPAAGLPVPETIAPYAYRPERPFFGNVPPPPSHAHDDHDELEHPHPAPESLPDRPPLLEDIPYDVDEGPDPDHNLPPPHNDGLGDHASQPPSDVSHAGDYTAHFLSESTPASLAAARARYTLKTGRSPPKGFDTFYDFAKPRGCLVDGYDGVFADFAPFWQAEKRRKGWFRERVRTMAEKLRGDAHGITVLTIRGGAVHQPETQGGYFDGDWERTISKFVHSLPPMQVLINGRDEPRVVFDVAELFSDESTTLPHDVATLSDTNPFGQSPASTGEFFRPRQACRPPKATGLLEDVAFLLSASSAEFTTDLVPVLSMTKIADGASATVGGHTCFADIRFPGEFYYRQSFWAGKFEYPNNIAWEDKKDVLYWRGKSNGGHIRNQNHKSFPRFRLIDLARQPEVRAKGILDVKITEWHEWHCTDNCDATAIIAEYNISRTKEPAEDAYKYKYLLDVDGNSFSGRYLGLLRSGGLVFKSTAFAEFFSPWLVPYEHYIPVQLDLSDLVEKVEWARANDAEARRIQESGRVFAERVLSDAQNDCYWFAVMMEWGALWGEA
ncbi:CAP10 domain-containing protein [Mycena chlorophos]|uniref:CAP10 domain-containing protein n=1 Tax=Mycena chlorophos TaxID=658473 RepID=A0A8H6RZ54_MYCCL|nr:CAP10 domain-containing protein [Mycena chlorophos]